MLKRKMTQKFTTLAILLSTLLGGLGCEVTETEIEQPERPVNVTELETDLTRTASIILTGTSGNFQIPETESDSQAIEIDFELGRIFVFDSWSRYGAKRPSELEAPSQTYCLTEDLQKELESFLSEPVCHFRHGEVCTMEYRYGYASFHSGHPESGLIVDMGGGNPCSYTDFCDQSVRADFRELTIDLRASLPATPQGCQLLYPADH